MSKTTNFSVLSIYVFSIIFLSTVKADDKYTSKYDNVDIDQILTSDRLLTNYVNCFLDKGRCTPDAAEVKKNLPDALENNCAKCSEKQQQLGTKVLNFLVEKKPSIFNELEKKYDPNGVYRNRYKNELKSRGINI